MIKGFAGIEEKDGVIAVTPYYEWANMPMRITYDGIVITITPNIPGDYAHLRVDVDPVPDGVWRVDAAHGGAAHGWVHAVSDKRQGRFEEIEPAYISTI